MSTTYLSRTDAARLLGVSRQRVCQFVAAGRLRARIVAGRPVIAMSDLVRFAAIPRPNCRHIP